jgi:hypothetical protein
MDSNHRHFARFRSLVTGLEPSGRFTRRFAVLTVSLSPKIEDFLDDERHALRGLSNQTGRAGFEPSSVRSLSLARDGAQTIPLP